MKAVGICIGSSSITYTAVCKQKDRIDIESYDSIAHEGDPKAVLKRLLDTDSIKTADRIAVTGRKFRSLLNAASISEPEAVEEAYSFVQNGSDADLIVSAGGETVMVYQIDRQGRILDITTGNKCASGTGEFFLQQLKRMDVPLENSAQTGSSADPYKVSGRCSVFCKSDCTHALNVGIPKANVVSGLSDMMAGKILELMKKIELKNNHNGGGKAAKKLNAFIVGGSSQNALMVDFLKERHPHVEIPSYATVFEALGTSLWALKNESARVEHVQDLYREGHSSFGSLPALKNFRHMVTFKENRRAEARPGDRCIIGLDVGSTTTKAVIIRQDIPYQESEILASVYLRTNGDPVRAARQCYASLRRQVPAGIVIVGLGVTGSGRQITGLHALTPSVVNEIIAHAKAAAFYDPQVDTIFEIGGQDAKYTYLTNGVASDYAMNEACSAGTGSFIEEAAKESLNIATEEIGAIAMTGKHPTNFSDQCAAFINSDIKTAIQEGIPMADITAGLVYSICENYKNRVKGARAVGNKVFMQGGVCYNSAIPAAMASLTGKEIVVPPEPGLMGAFGIALDVKHKLSIGLTEEIRFDLDELSAREVHYKKPFVCRGGKERCDRKCSVNLIEISGKTYPFGGACNKYYNLLGEKRSVDVAALDLVDRRERMVFDEFCAPKARLLREATGKTVGINRSLLSNTYYPLYYHFFTSLGYEVIHEAAVDPEGIEKTGAAFCFPVEISHGAFQSLVKRRPDMLFMPNVKSVYLKHSVNMRVSCPFVQAESNYLTATFSETEDIPVFDPVLDFAKGIESTEPEFLEIAAELGISKAAARRAFAHAREVLLAMFDRFKEIGRQQLAILDENPEEIGIVLFGRPYNAFSKMGNKGIPHKFASRGYRIIPVDFLDFEAEEDPEHVYWGMGETNVKGGKFIHNRDKLFGAYITNFSCGPDSFTVDYFRKEQGRKPSLTLELDNHTADAGLDTRIEAFLDVIKTYRELQRHGSIPAAEAFTRARIETKNNSLFVVDSKGERYPLTHPRVHLLIPSMLDLGSRCFAAVLRHAGIRADAVPDPTEKEFKLGLGYTSGKECLPAIITTGSLMQYLQEREDEDELLVYFMPGDSGPCRFGSYYVMMQNVIEKQRIPDVAFLSLSQEDGYMGFTMETTLRLWQVILTTDVLENIYSAILVLAKDREMALQVYRALADELVWTIEHKSWREVEKLLRSGAARLAALERKAELEEVPRVALINEMYVRRTNFARRYIVEELAEKGIVTLVGSLHEWMYYLDLMVQKKLVQNATLKNRLLKRIEQIPKRHNERRIKKILAESGFYRYKKVNTERILQNASHLVTPTLICESILITGTAITELIDEVDGIISIQPFGCMPGRIAESILSRKLSTEKLQSAEKPELVKRVMEQFPHLPFLTLEVDGQVLSQGIRARLETFCLQVGRLHRKTREVAEELGVER